jgi:hypothetical protein
MTFKMVRLLNKLAVLFVLCCLCEGSLLAQEGVLPPVYKDYKDPEQFEKFRRRRITVAAWQINTLKKEGALVVRLKTNQLLIKELRRKGQEKLATEKQLEQFAVNRTTMFAYLENFRFCKVYFIYTNHSDSLLNGARQGIFLDTSLNVDPNIVMNESFYLLAERDMSYSSSIGFVREDSARFIKETGNPIQQMAIVLKNKYGHQLKKPMPYALKDHTVANTSFFFPISYISGPSGPEAISFPVNRNFLADLKNGIEPVIVLKTEGELIKTRVSLKKEFTYEKLSICVSRLNEELEQVYKNYPMPDMERMRADIKPFLY